MSLFLRYGIVILRRLKLQEDTLASGTEDFLTPLTTHRVSPGRSTHDRETLDSLPKTNLLLDLCVLDLSYLSILTCKMETLSTSQHNMNEVYV